MQDFSNPRSTLHALHPLGLGTPAVESLTSYFCRLAHSHSVAAVHLARWIQEQQGLSVPSDYKWCQRNFVSTDEETERWAAWLAELTGVGGLDQHTLLPWRSRISTQGLAPKSDRWCPCCLSDDRGAGQKPYLRLAWDVAPVTACHVHKVELVHRCPHCQRTNVRNRSTVIVPGYCTACGGFLGQAVAAPATPEAMWVSRQIGLMLASPPHPEDSPSVANLMEQIADRLAGGTLSRFARHLGLSKSAVWNWLHGGGLPTIQAWLSISLKGGISLDRLLRGNLEGWTPPATPPQLSLDLPPAGRKGVSSRIHNWPEITAELQRVLKEEFPVSLAEVCRRMELDVKLVYLRANQEARAIAARHKEYKEKRGRLQEQSLKIRLQDAINKRLAAGYSGISARDVKDTLNETGLGNVRNIFSLIREVREARS